MTIREYIQSGKERLIQAKLQCQDPLLHMKQIVGCVLNMDSASLYLRWDETLGAGQVEALESFLNRRLQGEPFQYIAGYEWFWKSKFSVGEGVFIPRQDTETLVEEVIQDTRSKLRVVELGGGSGNIGLSVLLEKTDWTWDVFEAHPPALEYLRRNHQEILQGDERYRIHAGDFFSGASEGAPYDLLVSNPPYVRGPEIPELAKEIQYEPTLALSGGELGLDVIEKLVRSTEELLKPGGGIYLEIGNEQGEAVASLFAAQGLVDTKVIRDYAGLDRVVRGRKE